MVFRPLFAGVVDFRGFLIAGDLWAVNFIADGDLTAPKFKFMLDVEVTFGTNGTPEWTGDLKRDPFDLLFCRETKDVYILVFTLNF